MEDVTISFKHEHFDPPAVAWKSRSVTRIGSRHRIPLMKTQTCCTILIEGILQSSGYAQCSVHDQFSKSKGRKIALAEALCGWSTAGRRAVWRQYLSRGKESKCSSPTKD